MITNKSILYLIMIIFILTGSLANIIPKIELEVTSLGKKFQHVWVFLFFMFFNENFALFIFYCSNKTINSNKPECKHYHSIPSVIFDFFGVGINFLGLAVLPGSITQMLSCTQLIFTYLLDIIFTKNKHNINQYLGIIITMLGVIIIGFSGTQTVDSDNLTFILGIICVLISQFFISCQIIYEENISKKYECYASKLIGFQGVYGSTLTFIVILIFSNISCGKAETKFLREVCSQDNNNNWRVENLSFAIKQLKNSGYLIFLTIFYFFGDLLCNLSGITIGQNLSAMNRAILEPLKSIFVWIYFVLPFNPSSLREYFDFSQLLGFFFLVMGNLFYHNIIDINYYFNKGNNEMKEEVYEVKVEISQDHGIIENNKNNFSKDYVNLKV